MSWRRLLLVFWLALLQGASPLLHAHMLGQVALRGVHVHGLEVVPVAPQPYCHNAAPLDGTEIGVAQAARQDQRTLLPNLSQAALPRGERSLRIAQAGCPSGSPGAQAPPADAHRLIPPSQAPPLRLA